MKPKRDPLSTFRTFDHWCRMPRSANNPQTIDTTLDFLQRVRKADWIVKVENGGNLRGRGRYVFTQTHPSTDLPIGSCKGSSAVIYGRAEFHL